MTLWRATILRLALSLLFVGAIGLLTIGGSGLIDLAFGAIGGRDFVSARPEGVRYSAERCEEYFEYYADADSCAEAAEGHHFDEIVGYRLAAGVLGLAALGIFVLARRWAPSGNDALPEGFTSTVGSAVFGVAAVGFVGMGLMSIVFGAPGPGQLLADGLASLVTAYFFVRAFVRVLRRRIAAAG